MEIAPIEKKTYETISKRFALFAREVEALCRDNRIGQRWLDAQEVCQLLHISKRTLQYYRKSGRLPCSMIENKCYYKAADIERLVNESRMK